jgi:hypothetical protein
MSLVTMSLMQTELALRMSLLGEYRYLVQKEKTHGSEGLLLGRVLGPQAIVAEF